MSFLICFGFCEKAFAWVKEDLKRRLVFILEKEEKPLQHPQVKTFFLETPLQIEPLAKEIAWQAVFLEAAVIDEVKSPWLASFQRHFEEVHRAANLLLSDGAEWGVPFVRNARKNLKRAFRSALDLRGKFRGIPAIVVGAGPSLKKNGPLLKELSKRALILAGGTALQYVPVEPHFGAAIDPQGEFRNPFPKIPFCFQARVNPKSLQGEPLIAPDSHHAFLNWIAGVEEPFEGGWTVGNFLTKLALLWGCDPIVFVGMDHCYHGKEKYPNQRMAIEGLVEATDREGNRVWTQRDWIQAIRWTNELARDNPDRGWINATEGGMGFAAPIAEKRLEELEFAEQQGDLREKVAATLKEIAIKNGVRWEEWKRALQGNCEEGIVYEKLLLPLWHLWRPVFEREVDLDPHPIPRQQKIDLHRSLFFQQVIEEHAKA